MVRVGTSPYLTGKFACVRCDLQFLDRGEGIELNSSCRAMVAVTGLGAGDPALASSREP